MTDKPFFSIIMPTRNRSQLLGYAIRSVLWQSFGDFELIVSDNFSGDKTRQVAHEFDDPRIKYFRSEKPLSIADSYDFALGHARGEYIAFISDDDAYTPVLLERAKAVIDERDAQVVTFHTAIYYHNGDFAFNRSVPANTLAFAPFKRQITEYGSAEAIKLLYNRFGLNAIDGSVPDENFIVTYINNAVYHHSVMDRIKAVRANMFGLTPADMYLASALFFVIDRYYCLDEPLYVWSNWAENITASAAKKGSELREHYEKILNSEEMANTPLKFPLPENCIVNAVLQPRTDFKKETEIPLDWARYYVHIYDNLMVLRNLGVNVSNEIQEFEAGLSRENAEVQNQVRSEIQGFKFRSKQFFRRFPILVRVAKRLIRRQKYDLQVFVNGDTAGFDTVLGAASVLSKNLEEKIATGNE